MIYTKHLSTLRIALLGALVAAPGCATQESAVEADFGNSVREMIRAQTYDPSTLDQPSRVPVTGIDGEHAGYVLDTYRTDLGKPATITQQIQINVSE
jgi:type IV pilus biogenesis protein CpaD/CtpE